ncbi:uncharacterized protein LOC125000108 isoform X2 [Mugil cephalus]|uniref:uncharacterized protein LOC125000108 isoform X2 n=1 Tax=Mugil cephalus TaxID=48193 RepID=UPI001FB5C53B|nr:uncharacterized protein LOC125000108 isoform X2 [Mugil cephalus]
MFRCHKQECVFHEQDVRGWSHLLHPNRFSDFFFFRIYNFKIVRDMIHEQLTFRKPSPALWIITTLVLLFAVCCILVCGFTLSGHLLNRQSFDCGLSDEFLPKLTDAAKCLVWIWLGSSMALCVWLLLGSWSKSSLCFEMIITMVSAAIIMIVFYCRFQTKEIQEIQKFKERYSDFAVLPFNNTPRNLQEKQLTHAHENMLTNVYCWQTEFKCCGLETYQEWESRIPDSCLCDGEDGYSGCVRVGNSLVYEKIAFDSCNPSTWKYTLGLAEKLVPVVFIRKDNNNQMEPENVEDGKAKESVWDDGATVNIENSTNVEAEEGEEYVDDNPVKMIPLSLFKRLWVELNPPPVEHKVLEEQCLSLIHTTSSRPRNFYTILIEEGSPLLPSDAVLVDPNKPTGYSYWREGNRIFNVTDIIWPKQKDAA